MLALRSASPRCVAFVVLAALAVSSFAGEPVRQFGKDVQFTANDLPDSPLRQKMRTLPAAAQARAMDRLKTFSFNTQDVKSLRSDDNGDIFYACEFTPDAKAFLAAKAALAQAVEEPTVAAAPVPVGNPPIYHSRPSATRKIVLDFNGHYVTGTAWNGSDGDYDALPFDTDGDITTFSDAEQTAIKRMWQRIAEDFAPFDVDVTTEVPATFTNSMGRLLITRSSDRSGKLNPAVADGAAGVAYVGVFGNGNYASFYSPAWVYYDKLGSREDFIAEAASHEMGHNLGLNHDGTTSAGYYGGHGSGQTSWGPLMGTGYNDSVSQWSKGEYTNANNTQDDLVIITGRIPYRTDDHANSNTSATNLLVSGTSITSTTPENDPTNSNTQNKGVIESTADIDVFRFTTGAGAITLNVNPWVSPANTRGNNLDIRADLFDASGNLLVTANPDSTTGVTINYTASEGTYFLQIQGVGAGSPLAASPTGYTEYGSIGQYFISGTVQLPAGDQTAPTATLNASSVTSGGGTTHSFTVTYNDDIAVNVSSLDGNDLRVTGPNSFNTLASFISVTPTGNGSPRTATYRINAPGGTWDLADNGSYTVALQASQVSDTFGRFAAAGNLGTISVAVPIPAGPGTGIRREVFAGINGTNVSDLTGNAAYTSGAATSASLLTSLFESPSNVADNYGQRVHGYFIAPMTGTYFFYIASDDSSQLWLSSNNDPANAVQIASVSGFTGEREWTKFASQKSAGISLTAGSRYYIRALHKEGTGGDNLAVGVEYPGGTLERPIPGHRLDPFVPATYTATISATDATATETQGNNGAFTIYMVPPSLTARTVGISMSGTAVNGQDYTAIASTITVPAGQGSVTFTLSTINDMKFEGNETATATLQSGAGYALGASTAADVSILDNDVNSPPVALNAAHEVVRNVTLNQTLKATDADDHALTFSVVAIPTKGSVTVTNAATGAFSYTPAPGAMGSDAFTFRANDGFANSNTATITLNIQNGIPTAVSEQFTLSAMTASTRTLNAGDADGDALTAEVLTAPAQGTVTIDPVTLQFTYTPAANAAGTDTFSYRLSDGVAQSPTATVTLTLLPRLEISSSASATPNPALVDYPVLFTVAGSGSGAVTWTWDMGNGISAQGSQAAYAYTAAGTYNVLVTGTDAAGQTVTSTIAMVVMQEIDGGGATPPASDSDGDGVADVFEVLDGTDPSDPGSVKKIPFTLLKASGAFNFKKAASDGVALSGIFPDLSRAFVPANAAVSFIINGSNAALTLDAKGKGRGKTATASLGMKLKYGKKSKTTKVASFLGGDTAFKFKLGKSDLAAAWGIDASLTTAGQPLAITVDAILGGRIYTATIEATYKAKAGTKGVFKKK